MSYTSRLTRPIPRPRVTFLNVPLLIAFFGLTVACGGGGSNSNGTGNGGNGTGTGGSTPQIVISAVSSSSPVALTPLYLTTSGLNTSKPFTVTVSSSSSTLAIPPMRTQSNGTVVIATPLYIDPTSGNTGAVAASITITQGSITSAPFTINIQDIPQLSDYGTSVGQLSRAFYDYQQISLGLSQNGFQAIQATQNNSVNTTALQGHIATQLENAILARSDVDEIITNNSTQIGAGTLADGTSISFNSGSLEMMDRVIGMYLSVLQPDISAAMASDIKHGRYSASNRGRNRNPITASTNWAHGRGKTRTKYFAVTPQAGVWASILPYIGTVGGALSIVSAVRTDLATNTSTWDKLLASEAGAYSGLGIYGALFAGAAGPEIVAAAATAGLVIGAAVIATDIYKLWTNPNPVLANSSSGDSSSTLTSVLNAMTSPQGGLFMDSVGQALGGLAVKNGVVSLGQEVSSFLGQDGSQVGIQGAGLLNSTLQLYANYATSDQTTAQNAASQFSTPFTSNTQGFGNVTGTVTVSNSEGPILAGLTGMLIYDPSSGTQLLDMADENGDYDVIVPLENTTINYSDMVIYAFDPITTDNSGSYFILDSLGINLSGLTSSQAFSGPALFGVCNDTDAGDPDSDDPDCD